MSKIAVLHDNPPLSGKKFFLISMISPESRQKHSVHGFKLHDMCESEEEGKKLCEYYHKLDPDFDVLLGVTGKWCPWVFDSLEVTDVEYANTELTTLIKSHREKKSSDSELWEADVNERKYQIKENGTKEGQELAMSQKEPAVSIYFKVLQLQKLIEKRQQELVALTEYFETNYSAQEQQQAIDNSHNFPDTQPIDMHYTLLNAEFINKTKENASSSSSSY